MAFEAPPRFATHGDTLAWAPFPEWEDHPIPYTEHHGRTVHWDEWEVAPELTHITYECEACGYDSRPWYTQAKVDPLPGETFHITIGRKTRRSGKAYLEDADVPAWTTWQLSAYLCPACGDLKVYDRGRNGREFEEIDVNRPGLF